MENQIRTEFERNYKDTVFVTVFHEKEKLIELYNAIFDTDYDENTAIDIVTIKDVLFRTLKNDVSFVLYKRFVVLVEHQSSINGNLPLRDLLYMSTVLKRMIDTKQLYREKTVRIPRPAFIVLYNGPEDLPEYQELRLSDAYLCDKEEREEDALQLIVRVYNINSGKNAEILKKCETLRQYSRFMEIVRSYGHIDQLTSAAMVQILEYIFVFTPCKRLAPTTKPSGVSAVVLTFVFLSCFSLLPYSASGTSFTAFAVFASNSQRERDKELAQKKDVLAQAEKRIAELDVIFKRLYEDNISGKLSDERFIKLSHDYEQEQANLKTMVENLRQDVKQQEKQKINVKHFIAAVKKYTDMTQLDASILREFVEKIYISDVYTPDENEPRIKVRDIQIVYNFIGAFDFEEAREQSQAAQKIAKAGVA